MTIWNARAHGMHFVPEEVIYDTKARLIRVRAWGVDTIDDWNASLEKILELHETHGVKEVLVDVRDQQTAPSVHDVFNFAKDLPRTLRIAILVGPETIDDQRFLEDVAVNRGKRTKIFQSEDDALKWLTE